MTELREGPGAGPARHHALHGLRDAVRAMVGDAITEQGPARHPRLRRVAESGGRGREDGAGLPVADVWVDTSRV